jgi:spoIIIJ-associated protein
MEWVETTGRTVEDAKEAALDELGVDEADAEFEVIAEAQTGLFGRLRSEARVRARVRPTAPRAKDDRRDRRDRRRRSGSNGAAAPSAPPAAASSAANAGGPASAPSPDRDEEAASEGPPSSSSSSTQTKRRRRRPRTQSRPGVGGANGQPNGDDVSISEADGMPDSAAGDEAPKGAHVEVALEQQAEIAKEFLNQLTAEFGLQATVTVNRPDEETVELQLSGSDLGILIGPKGATLLAVQNLTRTVVFNETGANNGHINVDVGGYRQKRTEALARFATSVAATVKESGKRTAMEPMSSVDRKVVHDTIAEIDGVSTISEGEEPRRRVVVLPD